MKYAYYAMVFVAVLALGYYADKKWIAWIHDSIEHPTPGSTSIDRVCPTPDIILEWTCPDCNAVFMVAGKATRRDLQVFVEDHREAWHPNTGKDGL